MLKPIPPIPVQVPTTGRLLALHKMMCQGCSNNENQSSDSDLDNCVIAGFGSSASTEGIVLEDTPEEETRFNELFEDDVENLKIGGLAFVIDTSYDPGSGPLLLNRNLQPSEQEEAFEEGYYESER